MISEIIQNNGHELSSVKINKQIKEGKQFGLTKHKLSRAMCLGRMPVPSD